MYFYATEKFSTYRLTHLSMDKMAAILQMIFSDAFSGMKIYEF